MGPNTRALALSASILVGVFVHGYPARGAPSRSADAGAGTSAASGAGGARISFTLPLASPDLEDGVLTVKVVASGMSDVRVGTTVDLLHVTSSSTAKPSSAKTGSDGRARFEKLRAGETYAVSLGGARSEPFLGPAKGGLRLLATLSARDERVSDEGAAIPPGHPGGAAPSDRPASGDEERSLPPGHPAVGSKGRSDEDDAGEENGGAAAVEKAVDLGERRIEVLVRQRRDRLPIAGGLVSLVATMTDKHDQSVPHAKNELRLKTDAAGKALFEVPDGARQVVLELEHDGFRYRSRIRGPFSSGLRATFEALGRTKDRRSIRFGPKTNVVLQVTEGNVSFMEVLELENRGSEIFDPGSEGIAIPLPRGAVGVELPEEAQTFLKLEREEARVRLVTAVPPGKLPLRVFFQIAYRGERLEFQQTLPLDLDSPIVAVLGEPAPTVRSPAVEKSERREEEGRRTTLYTLGSVTKGTPLSFSIEGLPHRNHSVLYAVLALAGLIVLFGIVVFFISPVTPPRPAPRPEDREVLLEELASLEEKRTPLRRRDARRRTVILETLRASWEE